MDSVTQQNAAQTEELSSTAQGLAAQAEELSAQVGQFKLAHSADAQAAVIAATATHKASGKVVPLKGKAKVPKVVAAATGTDAAHGTFEEF